MNPNNQVNIEQPKHHHVFRIIALVVLLIIAILVSAFLSSFQFRKTVKIHSEQILNQVNRNTTRSNAEIIKEMNTVNQAKPLTEKEKAAILKSMKNENVKPLTDAQKAEIMSAMKASQN